MPPKKILFVCLGNIIRSPLGEGVFRHLMHEKSAGDRYIVDSAGTSGFHVGEVPDGRMRQTALAHGVAYSGRARQLQLADLDEFDLIVAMDRKNLETIKRLARTPEQAAKIKLMRQFDPTPDDPDVPDPYYDGQEGFEHTFQIVRRSVNALFRQLESGSE